MFRSENILWRMLHIFLALLTFFEPGCYSESPEQYMNRLLVPLEFESRNLKDIFSLSLIIAKIECSTLCSWSGRMSNASYISSSIVDAPVSSTVATPTSEEFSAMISFYSGVRRDEALFMGSKLKTISDSLSNPSQSLPSVTFFWSDFRRFLYGFCQS